MMERRTFLAALPAAVAGLAITDPAALLAYSTDGPAMAEFGTWMRSVTVGCEMYFESDRGAYRVTSIADEGGWPVFTFERTRQSCGWIRMDGAPAPPPPFPDNQLREDARAHRLLLQAEARRPGMHPGLVALLNLHIARAEALLEQPHELEWMAYGTGWGRDPR
jgi:hypothetical protein